MKKVGVCTLGCKVNQYETDLMEKMLKESLRYEIVDFEEKADIYIINSCSVTNLATRKSRQFLSRAKKMNKDAIIVLAGCYAEEVNKANGFDILRNVDIIIGNEEKNDIVSILDNYKKKEKTAQIKLKDISKVKKYYQISSLDKGRNIREQIKIEDGCNNFCTYCIIPYTRGRVRSRSLEDILEEVKKITRNNVKEIVIVGIEIASYGQDIKEDISLIDVVEKINEIETVERIRLGSIEPRWLTDENIARLSKVSKLCHHFHISIQSLSTSVLKRMNRKYTAEFVMDRIKKLRETFIDPGITTDLIVGFINETEDEFNDTLENVRIIKFSDMHVFRFSKRKMTAAYNMETTVTNEDLDRRSKILIQAGKESQYEFLKKYVGTTQKVLIDEEKNGYYYGYTDNYLKVKCKGLSVLWGWVQDLELISIEGNYLIGKEVQK